MMHFIMNLLCRGSAAFFENHRKITQVINLKNAKYQRVQVRYGEPV